MFDSITEAAAHEDDRWQLLRKAFFVVPPAFSAACLAVLTLSLVIDAKPLTDGTTLFWKIGMIAIPLALALLCATNGRWRWALGALVYGYAVAAATLVAAVMIIVGLTGSIH